MICAFVKAGEKFFLEFQLALLHCSHYKLFVYNPLKLTECSMYHPFQH